MNTPKKIVLVGEAGVGKTSFLRRIQEKYHIKQYFSTIGFKHENIFIDDTRVEIIDTPGQEKLNSDWGSFLSNADGIVLMRCGIKRQTLFELRFWAQLIAENASGVPIVIVSTKNEFGEYPDIDVSPNFSISSINSSQESILLPVRHLLKLMK